MADESLDAIARTDALLDAIAGERRFTPSDPDESELFGLLVEWRDDLRRRPVDDVIAEQQAVVALNRGKTEPVPAQRPRRGLAVVASAAAAVLCIGGFGGVVAGSGPGDALYGLHTMLFGEPQAVRDDKVALVAKTEMQQVQELIQQGNWDQAQEKLQAVSTQVQSVEDVSTKTDLIRQWNDLSVKVGTQDATATVPPMAPGEPVPDLPGVTFLSLPPMPAIPPLPPMPATEALDTEMLNVQRLIEQGDWPQAQEKLQTLSAQVKDAGNVSARTDLVEQFNELSYKVGLRDAAASLPPIVPGAPVPDLPGVTFLEVPPLPAAPTTSADPSGTTATSATTNPETTAPTSPTPSAAAVPATTSAATSNPAVTATTTVPASTPATTAASQAPATTSAPVTTTSAPKMQATSEVEQTSVPSAQATSTPSATTRAATTSAAAPAPTTSAPAVEPTSTPARATATTQAPAAQEPVSDTPVTAEAPVQRQAPTVAPITTTVPVPESGD